MTGEQKPGGLEVVAWPVVTDQWAETYCELTGRDPDGQHVTFVDGGTVTTFRDMAKREIEAMLCAAPKAAVRAIAALTPPAEPVSRPAGEGEREAVARQIQALLAIKNPSHPVPGLARELLQRAANLLSPAAPDAGGGWMPIETAPKDGTELLIYRHGWPEAPRAKWGDHDGEDAEGKQFVFGGWFLASDWISHGCEDGFLGWSEDADVMPTHWAPLPALQPGGER